MSRLDVIHLHLAINHSPLYTELFALALLIIGMWRRNRTLVTAGLVVSIIAALCGAAAFLTGDSAAEALDARPAIAGVDKLLIGPHDESANWFIGVASITGVAAIAALFLGRKRERPRWIEIVVTVLVALSLSVAFRTVMLGGRIHHPEVREVVTG